MKFYSLWVKNYIISTKYKTNNVLNKEEQKD